MKSPFYAYLSLVLLAWSILMSVYIFKQNHQIEVTISELRDIHDNSLFCGKPDNNGMRVCMNARGNAIRVENW